MNRNWAPEYVFSISNTSKTIISIETAPSNMALVSVTKFQNVLPVLSSVPPSDISTKEITFSGRLKTVCPVQKIFYWKNSKYIFIPEEANNI